MIRSMRRFYVLGWLQWHIIPIIVGVVVTEFVWQPMLQEYWIRNSPQGRLLLQSVGERIEAWDASPMAPHHPRVYIGMIENSELYTAWADTRRLRMSVSYVMDGNMAVGSDETENRVGITSGSKSIILAPWELGMAKVEGYPIQDTRPIPVAYETVWYLIAAANILVATMVFRGILKRIWFGRSSQVQAVRRLVPRSIQWWTNHGVVIGTLKKVKAEPCWNIRHCFLKATMEIEGDEGQIHRIAFTPSGLVWRLHREDE